MNAVSVEIVNVVGAGEIGVEVDLEAVSEDLDVETRYFPDKHTGMHIRLPGTGALITLYRTGSYHIVGVDRENLLFEARDTLYDLLTGIGIHLDSKQDTFSVRNIVCTADYGRSINLNALAIGLGLENVEYEPEQFPGLVYRPVDLDAVVLIFGSGKLVITGVRSREFASDVFERVSTEIDRLLSVD